MGNSPPTVDEIKVRLDAIRIRLADAPSHLYDPLGTALRNAVPALNRAINTTAAGTILTELEATVERIFAEDGASRHA